MVDLLHLTLDAVVVALSLALSFYCFRLLKKFFIGGIFEIPIKAFLASGLLAAAGTLLDILENTVGFELSLIHTEHFFYVFSVAAIFYGVYILNRAWTKLGPR